MQRLNTAELREKEVINLCDGSKLGCPSDFEFDLCDGKITALVIFQAGGFCGMGKGCEIIIPWCKIECIGEDAILVRLTPNEIPISNDNKRKNKKKTWQM